MTNWKDELCRNITTVSELRTKLALSDDEARGMEEVVHYFPMSISRYYFSLIDPDDPHDPIRKMCVPATAGLDREGLLDTSGEQSNTVLPGMQHKYRETVMILSTNQCGMYCRYCFRRRLVGLSGNEVASHIDEMVDYVKDHPEISDILISGGDALLNDNSVIEEYLQKFSALPQLDFIRIATRTPVTFPCRINSDPELQALLAKYNQIKQLYVVTHFNHPHELSEESHQAVQTLQRLGIPVKNQTVLLQGVNDDPDTLSILLKGLTSWGIIPHYIFQCRPVLGVKSRFQVPLERGREIVNAANARQNGLGKSAQYTMSHVTGKITILGKNDAGEMVFQYRQAKNPADISRIFTRKLNSTDTWLEEL